jgi:hypothetical protein
MRGSIGLFTIPEGQGAKDNNIKSLKQHPLLEADSQGNSFAFFILEHV